MHACPKDTFLEHKPVGFRLPVTSLGENFFFMNDGLVNTVPFTLEIENSNGETASVTINSAGEIGDNVFVDLDALV